MLARCWCRDLPDEITVEPIKGLPLEKDLVVDMEPFFEAYRAVKPFLMTYGNQPFARAHPVTGRARAVRRHDEMHLVRGVHDVVPHLLDGRVRTSDPAAIVNAHRFIFDSRDEGGDERLEILNDREGVWRCRTTFNCTEACPRGIEVTKAIAEVKKALLYRRI